MKSLPIIFLAFVLVAACEAQQPQVTDGKIWFLNGKTVAIPNYDSHTSVESIVFPDLSRIVVVAGALQHEARLYRVYSYSFSGEHTGTSDEYFGEFKTAYSAKRGTLFLCQIDSHYDLTEGILFDANAQKIASIEQTQAAYDCGVTGDGRYYWFAHHVFDKATPGGFQTLILIGSDFGAKVKELRVSGDPVAVTVDGTEYRIHVRHSRSPFF